ncbi:QQT2 [Symbiodinium sp. CCMP2592]|nr:QQT2 [Symbiodinium sp. CCMP2592]
MEVESVEPSTDPLRSIPKSPVVVLMIGMAGSGKSTFMHRMVVRLQSKQKKVYTVNLDPAVRNLAYPVNIDIRDTVNYKEVMKHFGLGPNGGIMTALNLFATKFDQVLSILGRRAESLDYVLIDTPGQIEVFNWSASGQIVCDSLAVSYPTLVCYVVDTARCVKPVTFMSNMLYACSILYKTKLPFIIAFNKIDVIPHDFLKEWMEDFEKLGDALSRETSYVASLARSMSLAMEEFYSNLRSVGVSAVTGAGCEDFEKAMVDACKEFEESYVPFLLEQRRDLEAKRRAAVEEQVKSFERGLDRAKRGHQELESEDVHQLEEDVRNFSIGEHEMD